LEGILRKILSLLALATAMVPLPALADLIVTPVSGPNAPIAITSCFGQVNGSGFFESSVNVFNRSSKNVAAVTMRYSYLDDTGRVIKSYENTFSANIGTGDQDGLQWNVPPPLVGTIQPKELRCVPVQATIGGTTWKRGDPWNGTLLPLPSPAAK
jgi:hypothetical protein